MKGGQKKMGRGDKTKLGRGWKKNRKKVKEGQVESKKTKGRGWGQYSKRKGNG